MLVLAFDTSTPAVSVAVVDSDDEILSSLVVVEANRHGELLAPMISEALAAAGVTPTDLAAVGVGVGPGPFTGLRVGIVTAKAISDALDIPAYGECSLDLIADQHGYDNRPFAVMSDARRKQVYWALYDGAGERIEGPDLGNPQVVADAIRDRITYVGGAGADLYREAFADFELASFGLYPSATDLGWRAAERAAAGASADALTPMYLRRPDAQPPGRPKQVTPA